VGRRARLLDVAEEARQVHGHHPAPSTLHAAQEAHLLLHIAAAGSPMCYGCGPASHKWPPLACPQPMEVGEALAAITDFIFSFMDVSLHGYAPENP